MATKDIFTKKDIIENGENAILYGEIARKYDCFIEEETTKINKEAFERATKIKKREILINLEDFDYENVGKCLLYEKDIPAAINGNVAILTLKEKFEDTVNLKYIAFYLNYKDDVRQYIYDKAVGEKVKKISRVDFENILIIIPTLEVQNKTVNNFIELKRQFEDDVAEIERKIKLIDGYSKGYVERVLNFKNKE